MASIPSGNGKSRVIAACIALRHEMNARSKFAIVFTSDMLKEVDEEKYKELAALLGIEV